jgi:hypothetical protein
VANIGKILIVGADGNVTLGNMPISGDGDIVGTIGDDNTIILSGEVPNGTYIFKYENADGTYSEIGTLAVGGVVEYLIKSNLTNCTGANDNADVIEKNGTVTLTFTANKGYILPEKVTVNGASGVWDMETGTLVLSNPTEDVVITIAAIVYTPYTNVLPLAQQGTSTDPYVDATTGAVGYGEGKRSSSSAGAAATFMKAAENVDVTGMIPVKRGDIIRLKNCNMKVAPANTSYGTALSAYDADKKLISAVNFLYNNIANRVPTVVENGEYVQFTLEPLEAWAADTVIAGLNNLAYIMIATDDLTSNSIITVNEEITE